MSYGKLPSGEWQRTVYGPRSDSAFGPEDGLVPPVARYDGHQRAKIRGWHLSRPFVHLAERLGDPAFGQRRSACQAWQSVRASDALISRIG
jgi:hypothetical protein